MIRSLISRPVGVFATLAVVALAVVVGVVLLLPRGDADVGRLKQTPFTETTIEAAVNILARSGVGTYATAESTEPIKPVTAPASPLTLLSDQVRAMALEAQVGGGIPGDEIDALIEIDQELAPPSYVLAGYVQAADTPASRLARELMGEQGWEVAPHVTFPQIVLVLFTADVVHERMAEAEARAAPWIGGSKAVGQLAQPRQPFAAVDRTDAAPLFALQQAGGPCSSVQNFINNALKRVFDALLLEEGSGIGGFFARIWNWVVGAIETIVTTIVKVVGQKVLNLIAKIAAVVGVVSVIVSAIRPWAVSIHHEPGITEKGTNVRPPDHGALVARVDSGGMTDWPQWAKDCASVAGQPLPSIKPEGTPVEWADLYQSPLDLAIRDSQETELDANSEARLRYTTLIDPIDPPYNTYVGGIWTRVILERQELRNLGYIAQTQLIGLLPGFIVQAIYAPLIKPEIDRIIDRLGRLITVTGWGQGKVLLHIAQATPPPTEPPPTPTPPPPHTPNPPPPGGGGPITTEPEGEGCEFTCPGSNGDPHVVTIDGYGYDFQAAGEFILLRDPASGFEVQARQEPFRTYASVSINTAVAVGLSGSRVGVYGRGEELEVRINGAEVQLDGETSAGDLVVRPVNFVQKGVEIQAPDGTLVWVIGLERWGINLIIDPSDELEASGMGVLGRIDDGDLPKLPDGSVVDTSDLRAALYGPFADAWAVTDSNTLFDYEAGAGPATFRDPAFPDPNAPQNFSQLSPQEQQFGLTACAQVTDETLRKQCAYDVVVTNDPSYAEQYLATDALHARRGGDACGLLTDEEIAAITGLPVLTREAGTESAADLPTTITIEGNAGCSWGVDGDAGIDPATGEPSTFDIELDLLSPGGRAAFDEDNVLFEAFHYDDVPELADRVDRAVTGSGAFEPMVVVRGDLRVVLDYINPFEEADEVRQQRIELVTLILDRL